MRPERVFTQGERSGARASFQNAGQISRTSSTRSNSGRRRQQTWHSQGYAPTEVTRCMSLKVICCGRYSWRSSYGVDYIKFLLEYEEGEELVEFITEDVNELRSNLSKLTIGGLFEFKRFEIQHIVFKVDLNRVFNKEKITIKPIMHYTPTGTLLPQYSFLVIPVQCSIQLPINTRLPKLDLINTRSEWPRWILSSSTHMIQQGSSSHSQHEQCKVYTSDRPVGIVKKVYVYDRHDVCAGKGWPRLKWIDVEDERGTRYEICIRQKLATEREYRKSQMLSQGALVLVTKVYFVEDKLDQLTRTEYSEMIVFPDDKFIDNPAIALILDRFLYSQQSNQRENSNQVNQIRIVRNPLVTFISIEQLHDESKILYECYNPGQNIDKRYKLQAWVANLSLYVKRTSRGKVSTISAYFLISDYTGSLKGVKFSSQLKLLNFLGYSRLPDFEREFFPRDKDYYITSTLSSRIIGKHASFSLIPILRQSNQISYSVTTYSQSPVDHCKSLIAKLSTIVI